MHSHSGQFCPGHAKDELEVIVKHAIQIGYKTMGLTEHMPRYEISDLYPEEVSGFFKGHSSAPTDPPLPQLSTHLARPAG